MQVHDTIEILRNKEIFTITSTNRIIAKSAKHNYDPNIYNAGIYGKIEMDNHADTHALGRNCTVLNWTGRTCNVSPFSDRYHPITNVEVVTAATAFDDPVTGETTILIFHEALWLGEFMIDSLINPNQCRIYGISICDDPFDPHRSLGIFDHNTGVTIPFKMFGTTAAVETRSISPNELLNTRQIVMCDSIPWDPSKVALPSSADNNPQDHGYVISKVMVPFERRIRLLNDLPIPTLDIDTCSHDFTNRCISTINVSIHAINTMTRHSLSTAEDLARKWKIGLETARKTLNCTTQYGIRHALHPLTRRYRTDIFMLNIKRLRTRMYTDTLFSRVISINGNKCAQIYCNKNYIKIIPMKSKSEAGNSLQEFIEDIGIPNEIIADGAAELTGPATEFMKNIRHYHIHLRHTEPHTPRQNFAERMIGEVKRKWKQRMVTRSVPNRLWDYGLVYESEIMSRTAKGPGNRTGVEQITGDSVDISEWLDFEFYDLVWYWHGPDMEENPQLGRWLGVSHRIGSAMCYWVINSNAQVLSRTTVQHVPSLERQQDDMRKKIDQFTGQLKEKLSDINYIDTSQGALGQYIQDVDISNDEPEQQMALVHDDYTADAYDQYLGAELITVYQGKYNHAVVNKRLRDPFGNPIGKRHDNPKLDTRMYQVEMQDGAILEYTANMIAENLHSQIDEEGKRYLIFKAIIDHRRDNSTVLEHHVDRMEHTTKGWYLLVEWRDGTTSWISLSELKASNPIETAEYAYANRLIDELAFSWWAKQVLRRRNHIISKLKSRYWRTTHKFGIKLPHSVQEALEIDRTTQSPHWREAIEKEMKNVRPAFERWDGTVEEASSGRFLVGYQRIKCHMIFDVKMDNLTRKARFVAGGHTTQTPTSLTYSSVVSRESVRIAFTLASLNGLEICVADVGNAYLNANCRERIWTVAGPEFGNDQGAVMIIKRALYGLKSSGAAWRAMFASSLEDMNFRNSYADPDFWIRPASHLGFDYYEMILVYVDDILCISKHTAPIMKHIASIYRLKDDSIGEPKRYLGANIGTWVLGDGRQVWSMSAASYIKSAVANIESELAHGPHRILRSKAYRPMKSGYRPEIDVTPLLPEELAAYYQGLIGVLRWICEIGRIDILTEVSMLSSFNAMPREGHLDAVLDIFAYLKQHQQAAILFDDAEPKIDERRFKKVDWTSIYGDVQEELPPHMPKPLGAPVKIHCFVDADHAGNLATRRSHTGILIFVNMAPIIWYSKRQNTVESSTFGSEFVALRTAVELIISLRYKLRMFGVHVDGPANVFCDNQGVVYNSTSPESVLTKKHNSICYHRVREAAAADIIRVAKEDSITNLADALTKPLPKESRKYLFGRIMYGLYFDHEHT
jgi:hypothetical protein